MAGSASTLALMLAKLSVMPTMTGGGGTYEELGDDVVEAPSEVLALAVELPLRVALVLACRVNVTAAVGVTVALALTAAVLLIATVTALWERTGLSCSIECKMFPIHVAASSTTIEGTLFDAHELDAVNAAVALALTAAVLLFVMVTALWEHIVL